MAENNAAVVKEGTVLAVSYNREWKGPKGVVYYFNVEFTNGDRGQFSTNKNPQTKFIEGETHKYTVVEETKQGPNGPWKQVKINRYQPPQDRQYAQNYNDPNRKARIMRSVAVYACMEYMSRTHINEGREEKIVPTEICEAFVEWMVSVTDKMPEQDREGANIASQTGIKAASISLALIPEEEARKYADIDKFLKLAAYWFNYVYFGPQAKE